MNDMLIVTVYVVLDDLLRAMRHRTDCRAQTSDSDTAQRAPVTVGVIAACQFANLHDELRGDAHLLPVEWLLLGDDLRHLATLRTHGRFFHRADLVPVPVLGIRAGCQEDVTGSAAPRERLHRLLGIGQLFSR